MVKFLKKGYNFFASFVLCGEDVESAGPDVYPISLVVCRSQPEREEE